jgi:GNAT superfamily N-acetyltransferase
MTDIRLISGYYNPKYNDTLRKFGIVVSSLDENKDYVTFILESNNVVGMYIKNNDTLIMIEVIKEFRGNGYGKILLSSFEKISFINKELKEIFIHAVLNDSFFLHNGYKKLNNNTWMKSRRTYLKEKNNGKKET